MFRFGPPSDKDSSVRNVLKKLSVEKRNAIRYIAVHKEEIGLDNVWEMLPQLRGLKTMVLWGCHFTWGTERQLARNMWAIETRVRDLVRIEVEATATVELLEEIK